MRSLLLIGALLLSAVAGAKAAPPSGDLAQMSNKEWVGPEGEYLRITEDSAILETHYDHQKATYYVKKGYLVMHISQFGSDHKDYSYDDSFAIEKVLPDTLILRSVKIQTHMGRCKFRDGNPVVMVNYKVLTARPFHFQGVYHSFHGGMSPCQGSEISIDSNGHVLFAAGPGNCGSMNGTFEGQLSRQQLQDLSRLVNNSVPDRFSLTRGWEDGGSTEFRFSYNNTWRSITGQGLPYLAAPLEHFLAFLPTSMMVRKISDNYTLK